MTSAYRFRSGIIFFLFFLLYLIIVAHLYWLQVRNHDFYKGLGAHQYSMNLTIPSARGAIFDRNGHYLALNKDSVTAFILPKQLSEPEAVAAFLEKHFPQAYRRYKASDKQFMFIKRALAEEERKLIEEAHLDDIKLLQEPNRYYPVEAAAQVVGLTDIDNMGQFGIEKIADKQLAGEPTSVALQKDARSGKFYFKKETRKHGLEGKAITLTLDADLQFLIADLVKDTVESFQADSGGVIVLDPEQGDIIAMVNYPSFDPNDTRSLKIEHTKNNCLTDVHEPGSVIKPLVVLGLLEEGLVDPDEIIDCENRLSTKVNGIPVNTVIAQGELTLSQVIQKSNNIGIVKVAQRLGSKIYDHYQRVGFGKKTELQWPGEQAGFVNHPDKWSGYSLRSLAFGYEIMASNMQIARAFSLIANGGHLIEPRLFLDAAIKKSEPLYSPETIATMQDILEKTVMSGSGFRARMKGYRVMGKTGTTNKLVNGLYDPSQNVYLFAGIIQKDSYSRVIVTFVNNAHRKRLYASQVTAPLFERVAQQLVIHDRVIQ
jgi:cell division protein FtsI (penicillin-binding protein 3)